MTKSIKLALIGTLILIGFNTNAQTENSKSEIEQITETLMKYIDGTAVSVRATHLAHPNSTTELCPKQSKDHV